MKNMMYIDSNYIFLIGKDCNVAEKYLYEDTDNIATLKYIFKKFKDNKFLNKNTYIFKLSDLDNEISKHLYNVNNVDLFSLNLHDYGVEKIISDSAIYKYDKISSSYEKTNFDINLYNLDIDTLDNYIINQSKNTTCKLLLLLKHNKFEEAKNIMYLEDLFMIARDRYKSVIDKSHIINIVLDIIIAALLALLVLRFVLWEST